MTVSVRAKMTNGNNVGVETPFMINPSVTVFLSMNNNHDFVDGYLDKSNAEKIYNALGELLGKDKPVKTNDFGANDSTPALGPIAMRLTETLDAMDAAGIVWKSEHLPLIVSHLEK